MCVRNREKRTFKKLYRNKSEKSCKSKQSFNSNKKTQFYDKALIDL